MVALITGISGQDGAYLAKLLLQKGYHVIGTTRNIHEFHSNLKFLSVEKQIELVSCDFKNEKDTFKLIEKHQPTEIYNLAAQSSVGYSFIEPKETIEFNVISVLNILNSINKINKKIKFYQASSSEMFGNINALPVKEDGFFHPSSPYAISKASAHWLTVNYREGYDLFAVCGILFNHESALRDYKYVTKKILNTAIRISQGEKVQLKLGNLEIYRDWGYAPKYVEAMWKMMQKDKPKDYLICSNSIMSLKDFTQLVFSQLKLDFNEHTSVDESLFRAVDLERMWGDNAKAKKDLSWDYSLTQEELISQLIQDEIQHMEWIKKEGLN